MDGDHHKDTLDALADLFLTGTIPGGSKPVRVPPQQQPAESEGEKDTSTNSPSSSSSSSSAPSKDVADQLDGPASIPLHPKPDREEMIEERKEVPVTPLRLACDDDDERDTERSLPPSRVEALFVGNLPGWSGPWLVQYAHFLARQRGPVAMLHVDDDQVEIELVTSDRVQLDAYNASIVAGDADADNLFSVLDLFTFNMDAPVTTWLIHLPAPSEPRQKSRAAELRRWTVLTGADSTAIAAGDLLLKQLLQRGPETDAEPESESSTWADSHRIGAMVMGSDEAKSLEAVARFNSKSAELLGQPIELIGHRAAMEPVHVKQFGPYTNASHWPRLVEYLNELLPEEESEPVASIQPDAETETGSSESVHVTEEELAALGVFDDPDDEVEGDANVDVEAGAQPDVEPDAEAWEAESPADASVQSSSNEERYESETESVTNESESAVFDQAEAVASSPVVDPRDETPASPTLQMAKGQETPTQQDGNQPDLTSMLASSIGGGVALEAKCPRQPEVHILLDENGGLHLLRQQIDTDLRAGIVDLMETRDWVAEHIQVLALTQRQCQFDFDSEPTLHLFADDAKSAVALVNKLGPSVKLHLIQRVNVGTQGTWVCTDLN